MESERLVDAAHRYHTTVTKYLTAVFVQSIWLAAREDGDRGKGRISTGRSGDDLFVDIPCGTLVWIHPRGARPSARRRGAGIRPCG